MTRKDFELIAHVIREWQPISPIPQWVVDQIRDDLARDIADALARTNPHFDRDRFITAATGGN